MNTNDNLSDTEKFFYQVQSQMGGNLSFQDLDTMSQLQFVQCINFIRQACSARKGQANS